MDAAHALADLTEISSQIDTAALVAPDGRLLASTFGDEERGERFARAALEFLAAADEAGRAGAAPLVQVEAATPAGSLFVVRDDGDVAAAVTRANPTSGLIFYDLKTCLRLVREEGAEERSEAAPPSREEAGHEGP